MRLGIFGGTFDPPHIAHLVLASEARHQLELDLVLWVLTLYPPHKHEKPITGLQHRLDMVQAAIDPDPYFRLSRIDIDRPPPHYAVDTLALLASEFPEAALVYLMGGDSLINLFSWHKPLEFVNRCETIGVLCRLDSELKKNDTETLNPAIKNKIRFIDAPIMDISASQIRNRIRENRTYRYFVPPSVYKIIEDRNLYRNLEK